MNDLDHKARFILALSALAAGALFTTASAVAQNSIPVGQMPRYCTGEASAALGVKPQEISTEGARRSGGRYVVRGRTTGSGMRSMFECNFDGNGIFDQVVVTGGAGGSNNNNYNQSNHQDIPGGARSACLRRFGGGGSSKVSKVSALRPGYWEVMMDNNSSGRSVACTVESSGDISQWVELGGSPGGNQNNSHGPASQREIPQSARSRCLQMFSGGADSRVKNISALRPGFWEVMMENSANGRMVACTVTDNGEIENWVELN